MKMRQVRNLIYLIYLTIILLSVILALINLPQVSQTHKGVPLNDRVDSVLGQRQFFSQNLEEIPADGRPFNWMEHLRKNTSLYSSFSQLKKSSQFRNLTNLLNHKLFLETLPEHSFHNKSSVRKFPHQTNDASSSSTSFNSMVQNFYKSISSESLYPRNSPWIDWIKTLLRVNKIIYAENKPGGSQLKLSVKFESNVLGLLKPMRLTRDQETFPDHFYFVDLERHNAEIAAYYLDQLLDFRRAPPVVGRWVNLTELGKISDHRLTRTFFKSPAENSCFHGTCDYYCRTETPVCGHPHMIEVSIALYLPDSRIFPRSMIIHPYRRSYTKSNQEQWMQDDGYCEKQVLTQPLYSGETRRIFDITDLAIYDFLMGNMDRHHYENFDHFGEDGFVLHLDQGKGFGRHSWDEISILAPLYHCCKLRYKTWTVLNHITQSAEGKLGDLLHDALEDDLLTPVLSDEHYKALDRRLKVIMSKINKCLVDNGPKKVFDMLPPATQE